MEGEASRPAPSNDSYRPNTMITSESITAPAVSSAPVGVPVQIVPPTVHDVARELVSVLCTLPRSEVPAYLAKGLRDFATLAPVKVEFSKVREVRKRQMAEFKQEESVFRSAIGVIYRFAEEVGIEHKAKFGFSVSASGVSTLSDTRKSIFRPTKSSRVSF